MLADTPSTWPDPPPMSSLHGLLLFVGVPALIICVITLLVMAPSLAKGPRYRPSQQWDAAPEWFGDRVDESDARRLESSPSGAPDSAERPVDDSGGASATW